MFSFYWSGWQDSNLRPPRPKRGAITGLRYTPIWLSFQKNCGENGTRTHATLARRQISNLLRYHSGTSPEYILMNFAVKRLQMYIFPILKSNYFGTFFL